MTVVMALQLVAAAAARVPKAQMLEELMAIVVGMEGQGFRTIIAQAVMFGMLGEVVEANMRVPLEVVVQVLVVMAVLVVLLIQLCGRMLILVAVVVVKRLKPPLLAAAEVAQAS